MMASGVAKSNMEAWMNLTHPDVRTKKEVKDALRQTSLLEYTCQSGTTYGWPTQRCGANAGRLERHCSFDGSFANDIRLMKMWFSNPPASTVPRLTFSHISNLLATALQHPPQ